MTRAEMVEHDLAQATGALVIVNGEVSKDQAIACAQVLALMALANAVLAVAESSS